MDNAVCGLGNEYFCCICFTSVLLSTSVMEKYLKVSEFSVLQATNILIYAR